MSWIKVSVETVHWWSDAHNHILYFIIFHTRAESAACQNGLYYLLFIRELIDLPQKPKKFRSTLGYFTFH